MDDHSWEETLEVFTQAGRGMAAAHAVGLVHRDFKPSNVLVTDDGRVKVTDFGLAKPVGEMWETMAPGDASSNITTNDGSERSVDQTRTGIVLGTPMYMALEQHTGEAVDAGADQYAFCLALWAALCGASPFAGVDNELELLKAKIDGPPAWPRAVAVPRALSSAVARGLAPDTDERFASMEALLAALSPQVRRSRWRGVAVGAVATTVAFGASLYAAGDDDPCPGAEGRIAEAWGPEARAAVDEAIAAVPVPHASTTWSSVAPRLDDYARG